VIHFGPSVIPSRMPPCEQAYGPTGWVRNLDVDFVHYARISTTGLGDSVHRRRFDPHRLFFQIKLYALELAVTVGFLVLLVYLIHFEIREIARILPW
jgi:hypothetical protein